MLLKVDCLPNVVWKQPFICLIDLHDRFGTAMHAKKSTDQLMPYSDCIHNPLTTATISNC